MGASLFIMYVCMCVYMHFIVKKLGSLYNVV